MGKNYNNFIKQHFQRTSQILKHAFQLKRIPKRSDYQGLLSDINFPERKAVLEQKNKTRKQILPFCDIISTNRFLDRGQTREICRFAQKKENTSKERYGTVIFTVQSLVTFHQYCVDLLAFLEPLQVLKTFVPGPL